MIFSIKSKAIGFSLSLVFSFVSLLNYAQCPVQAFANPIDVFCGDSVFFTAVADGCKPLDKDFNDNTLGNWAATRGAVVNNGSGAYSCVGTSPEGTHNLWMGADSAAPRNITTNAYDLTQCSATGGTVCFWLKFSTQGGPAPCEGIDLPEEGVSFQYSLGGGIWVPINYFTPNGGYDPVMTKWTNYCYNIPPAAMTANTAFRWYQEQSSGAGFDTWGLDHLVINLNSPGYTFDWAHDLQAPSPSPATPGIVGVTSSAYTVTYTNGVESCNSSVSVTVGQPTAVASANPIEVCAGEISQLDVVTDLVPPVPAACGPTITGCQGNTAQLNFGTGNVNETSFAPLGVTPIGDGSSCLTILDVETGNYTQSNVTQVIIQASEFPAFFRGGQLYNLTLFALGSSGVYDNFSVAIGCTNKTEFASGTDFIGGLTTVFEQDTVTFTPNAATILDFDLHYDWPGTGNIVIQFCYSGNDAKRGNLVKTATPNFSTVNAYSCGNKGCGLRNNANRYQFRPNLRIGVCYRPLPNISYDWTPAADLDDATIQTPLATVNATTTYTVVVTDAARLMCAVSDMVTVNVVQPSVTVSPSPAQICASGGSVELTATGVPSVAGGSISYAWSPATGLSNTNQKKTTASPAVTTTYTVTVTDDKGCSNSTTVTVNIGAIPAPTAVDGSRCGPGTVSLGATGCSGILNWYDASTGGTLLFTGNPFTTPSISTNTTYYSACEINGCESPRTAVNATINPAPDASFTYDPTSYCQTGTSAFPTFTTGTPGAFTSTSGLTINATTGEVTATLSTPGDYVVTNSLAKTAGCPITSATANITIAAPPSASFQYNGSPFCATGKNPFPVYIGLGQAGTFSSTVGLVFFDVSTGKINLAASTPASYTVTNTIAADNGCAAVVATFNIVINPGKDATFAYGSPSYCKSGVNPTPGVTGTPGGTFTSSPAGLNFINSSSGKIKLNSSATGSYTITYTTTSPCAVSSSQNVTITGNPVATFNYGNAPYCQTAGYPNPTFTGGGTAGNFSAAPAGLVFVLATPGQVNLAASTPGTYTVTNTVNSAGCATVTATANITISAQQTADFNYSPAVFCQTDPNATPTINSPSIAGVFSATPSGLVFASKSTGQINIAGSTPSTYTITNTVATSGGCPAATATQNITINATQSSAFSYPSGTYCATGTDPKATITGAGSGFFSAPAGLVFLNTTNGKIDLSSSTLGTYTVTYATPGPCPSSTNISITITSAPSAVFSYGGPYCLNDVDPSPSYGSGASAGNFTATPAGLVFVNTNTGEVDLSASAPNTYTVTNTIPAGGGCLETSASATIILNPTDDATFDYANPAYCSNTANPEANIIGTGGGTFTSDAGLIFDNNSIGEINLVNSSPGLHTITYTTLGSCPDNSTFDLTIDNPSVPDFEFTASPFCQDEANPLASYLNSGVAGTFSELSGDLIFDNVSTGQVNLSASIAGTYTVTNTLPINGTCPSVFYNSPIEITAVQNADFNYPSSPYCLSGANPTINLFTGSTSGTFSSPDPNITVNPATGEVDLTTTLAGTYTVTNTVAASGGCPGVTFSSDLTINEAPTAGFVYLLTPYCQTSGTATVNMDGGATMGVFTSNANVVIDATTGDINLMASLPGTHTVFNTVDAGSGCPSVVESTTIEITAPQDPTFDYADAYCNNETDPTPTFDPGSTAGTFTAAPAGLVFLDVNSGLIDLDASTPRTYTITNTVTGSAGCPDVSATDMVTINPSEDAGFSYALTTYCVAATDPTPTITGTTGGVFSFTPNGLSINTGTGLIDLDQSIATTYNITYTTSGACFADSTVILTITSSPEADFAYDPATYCETDVNPLPVYMNGGSPGVFTAAPAGLIFVNPSTGEVNLAASAPNNYNVTNTITASGSCPGDQFTNLITVLAIPDAEFSYAQARYCQNETNPLAQHTTGIDGTYSSLQAGLVFANIATGTIDLAASTTGNYDIQNIVFGSGSCENDTAWFNVDIFPMPTVNSSSNAPVCEGSDLELYVTTAPVDPSSIFLWSGPNSFSSPDQNPVISPVTTLASGDYTVQITTNGCTSFEVLTGVTITPSPGTTFLPIGPFCEDEASEDVQAADAGGQYSGNGITDPVNGTFDPATAGPGTHTIYYSNNVICVYDSVDIVVNGLPVVNFTSDVTVGCVPLTVQFTETTTGGTTYDWDFGDGGTSTQNGTDSHTFPTVGCFDVTLTATSNGCATTLVQGSMICTNATAIADFSASPPIADITDPEFTFNNSSTNASNYLWDFGDGSTSTQIDPIYTYLSASGDQTVTLIANNAANCPDTIVKTVKIKENLIYFVPNTFTPDFDKFNHVFMPVMTSGFDENFYQFDIYNRWGESVFSTTDYKEGWDGRFKELISNEGAYIWTLRFKSSNSDEVTTETGSVILLK